MTDDATPIAVMTVPEVAALLRVAESTVYRLAQEGKLPAKKVGGTWRFPRKGLEAWLMEPDGDGTETARGQGDGEILD